jgi:hypothetical protein
MISPKIKFFWNGKALADTKLGSGRLGRRDLLLRECPASLLYPPICTNASATKFNTDGAASVFR